MLLGNPRPAKVMHSHPHSIGSAVQRSVHRKGEHKPSGDPADSLNHRCLDRASIHPTKEAPGDIYMTVFLAWCSRGSISFCQDCS